MDNTIIMYEGGGYDGCFWEYNAMLKYAGELHDVYTSGYDGVTLFSKKRVVSDDRAEMAEALKWAMARDHWLVQLDKQESIDELTSRVPASFSQAVLQTVTLVTDKDYSIKCDICGGYTSACGAELSEPHGAGGIIIVCDDYICDDCVNNGTCGWCNKYVSIHELQRGVCDDCTRVAFEYSPDIFKCVNDLYSVMRTGKVQLSIMCDQRPDKSKKFVEQHQTQLAIINTEIDELMFTAFRVWKGEYA